MYLKYNLFAHFLTVLNNVIFVLGNSGGNDALRRTGTRKIVVQDPIKMLEPGQKLSDKMKEKDGYV